MVNIFSRPTIDTDSKADSLIIDKINCVTVAVKNPQKNAHCFLHMPDIPASYIT